jgi:hypothetical protein
MAAVSEKHDTTPASPEHSEALEAAEIRTLSPYAVSISGRNWQNFETWMSAPPRQVPALQRLAESLPSLEE